jgi:hypothetical protein
MSRYVLHGLSCGARLDHSQKKFQLLIAELIICVTEYERSVSANNMGQERSRFATRFRHARLSQVMRSL